MSHGVADKNDVSMREMGGGCSTPIVLESGLAWMGAVPFSSFKLQVTGTCCKVDPPPGGSVPNARLDLEGVHFGSIGSE